MLPDVEGMRHKNAQISQTFLNGPPALAFCCELVDLLGPISSLGDEPFQSRLLESLGHELIQEPTAVF